MRSFAGLEKPHSSMLQGATESLQPHLQASRAPTRRTSTLGFSDAVWARAATATSAIRSHRVALAPNETGHKKRWPVLLSFFDGRMFLGDPHHFRTGVLHLDFAWDQADEGAPNQHQAADPNPGHQREVIRLNHGPLVVVRHAAEVQIQVSVQPRPDADLGGTLPAGLDRKSKRLN